jgi:hypothetical protein
MNILLIGEFSNVHWSLAEGLRSLGHSVTVASDGDAWKNFPRNIDFHTKGLLNRAYASFNRRLAPRTPSIQFVKLYPEVGKGRFDIVQVINPLFIHDTASNVRRMFSRLKRNSGKIFLGAYGDDSIFALSAQRRDLRYSILSPYLEGHETSGVYSQVLEWLKPERIDLNTWMADQSDGIVAGAFEYFAAYRHQYSSKLALIPFPVNVDNIPFDPLDVGDGPIKFLHGRQKGRETFKGTSYILDAMEVVKERFGSSIEMKVTENLGFREWTSELSQHHVLLDQVYGYSQGMSALQAMAGGRICFAGCEPEFMASHGLKESPVFNLLANVEHNVTVISNFLDAREKIEALSAASRDFVRKLHDHRMIASKQLAFWTR